MKRESKNKRIKDLPPLEISSETIERIMAGDGYQLTITAEIGVKDEEGKLKSARIIIPENKATSSLD